MLLERLAQIFLSCNVTVRFHCPLILGWFTRFSACAAIVCALILGYVFFAGEINKFYVMLLILLVASLLPSSILGPGKISLDYNHAVRKAQSKFRG